jgi:hypothetical protein
MKHQLSQQPQVYTALVITREEDRATAGEFVWWEVNGVGNIVLTVHCNKRFMIADILSFGSEVFRANRLDEDSWCVYNDGFKGVNDSHGHPRGGTVLYKVARCPGDVPTLSGKRTPS